MRRKRQRASVGRQEGWLSSLRPGDVAVIREIHDDRARAVALRFGVGTGALVSCVSTVPGGPVVLMSGRQEIAFGRGLACRIRVDQPKGAVGDAA